VDQLILARAGFGDILIANQVVDAAALDEVAEAAALARLTVVIDHELQVDLLARAATRRGVPIGALIELDVGAGRCGLPFGDTNLVPLAEQITRHEGLSFRGLQAYEGHAVHRDSREVRATLVQQAALQIKHERDRLAAALPDVRFSFEPADIVSRVMSFGAFTPIEVAAAKGRTDLAAGAPTGSKSANQLSRTRCGTWPRRYLSDVSGLLHCSSLRGTAGSRSGWLAPDLVASSRRH